MKKEYVSYGLIGVIVGLVFGFLFGNWTSPLPGAAQVSGSGSQAQSVNASGPNPNQAQLPPDHPPVNPGEVVPAGPLPEGTPAAVPEPAPPATGSAPAESAAGTTELPSLDPLPASSKEERAEQKYKNIQILRGVPADRLPKIMAAFKGSLGVDCTYCHINNEFDKDDKPAKQVARKMIELVRDNNEKLGAGRVSCNTCHRGQPRPEKAP
jgi:hypothetical protein